MPRNCIMLAGVAGLALMTGAAGAQPAAAPPTSERQPPRTGPDARTQPPRSEQQHAEQARRDAQDQDSLSAPHAEAQNRETAQREQRQQEEARRSPQPRREGEPRDPRQGDRPGQMHPDAQPRPAMRPGDQPNRERPNPDRPGSNRPNPDRPQPDRPSPDRTPPDSPGPTPRPDGDLRETSYKDTRGRDFRVPTDNRVRVVTQKREVNWSAPNRLSSLAGCPPGIAGKYQGCALPARTHPPEKAWHDPRWFSRDYDDDTRYRYADGYMLQMGSGNSVSSYVPLLGGALTVGRAWPGAYHPVALPGYYTRYYGLGGEGSYRYYDNTIYRVNSGDTAITGVAALLTGNAVRIGRPMPAGYEVYNVPHAYRGQYYDGPDAVYRYSDGYIYQLDPATRFVRAAIELLA